MGNDQHTPQGPQRRAAAPQARPAPRSSALPRVHMLWNLDSARLPDDDAVPVKRIAKGVMGIARACGTLVTADAFGTAAIARVTPKRAAALRACGIHVSLVSKGNTFRSQVRLRHCADERSLASVLPGLGAGCVLCHEF